MSDQLTDAIDRLDAGLAIVPEGPLRDMLKKTRNRASGALIMPSATALAIADGMAAQGRGVLEQLRQFVARQEALTGPERMSKGQLDGLNAAVWHVEDIVAGLVQRWVES